MKSKLFINGQRVDLKDDISIPLTFVNTDLTNQAETKRSSSKSIVLPATKNNKRFFNSVWRTDYVTTDESFGYDSTGRTEAQLYSDDVLVFDGLFQLRKVVTLKDQVELHGVLYSNVITIKDKVGDLNLNELGWEEYDHTLSQQNIEASWNTTVSPGVMRPEGTLVTNFDSPFGGTNSPVGFGYFYGLVDWGLGPELRGQSQWSTSKIYPTWKHNEIVPLVYVKEILYKIFTKAGYTFSITSAKLGSGSPGSYNDVTYDETTEPATGTTMNWSSEPNILDRMLLSYEGGSLQNLSAADITNRQVDVTGDLARTATGAINKTGYLNYFGEYYNQFSIQANNTITFETFSPTSTTDPSAQYNDGIIDTGMAGNYELNLKGDWKFIFAYTFTHTPPNEIYSDSTNPLRVEYGVYAGGRNIVFGESIFESLITNAGVLSETINITLDEKVQTFLNERDQVRFYFRVKGKLNLLDEFSGVPAGDWRCQVFDVGTTAQIKMDSIDKTYSTGNTVKLATYVPKLNCLEFLKGFLTMFNLIMDEPDENGLIKIYDRASYWNDRNDFIDWSDKLDREKPIEIIPASNIQGKYYNFKFADETDYLHTFYRNRMKQGYGNRIFEVESTFQKKTVDIDLPFSIAIPAATTGGSLGTNTWTVPRVVSFTEGSLEKAYTGKPRIMMVGDGLTLDDTGFWRLEQTGSTTGKTFTGQPQVSHVWTATFGRGGNDYSCDLLFQQPNEIYFTPSNVYRANDAWKYHNKWIRELTNRDSKIMIAYFKLDSQDVSPPPFRDYINIDGTLWKLNIINEWTIGEARTVKCELIKDIEITINDPLTTVDPSEPSEGPSSGPIM